MTYKFVVSIEVEERTGHIQAVYFRFRPGRAVRTEKYSHGDAFADYDSAGNLLGIELLAPVPLRLLNRITGPDPATQAFVRRSVPREMAVG
jgi:uncharacterized protein YuzE